MCRAACTDYQWEMEYLSEAHLGAGVAPPEAEVYSPLLPFSKIRVSLKRNMFLILSYMILLFPMTSFKSMTKCRNPSCISAWPSILWQTMFLLMNLIIILRSHSYLLEDPSAKLRMIAIIPITRTTLYIAQTQHSWFVQATFIYMRLIERGRVYDNCFMTP